jgi:hypothetical protein
MKKLVFAFSVIAATMLAGEFKGVISETKCGAAHTDGSEKSINCIKACVKAGAKPVLVGEGGKIYKLSDPTKVDAHLGHKVVVTGDLKDDTITIASVKMDH